MRRSGPLGAPDVPLHDAGVDGADDGAHVDAHPDGTGTSPRYLAAWWARPQVVAALILVLGAAWFAWWARPAPLAPPPVLEAPGGNDAPTAVREVTLYRVADGLATPMRVEVPAPDDPSARMQAVVDALRVALIDAGDWPEALPSPTVFMLRIERDDAVVLDLPDHDAVVDVQAERTILASLERTLGEQGVDRVAYLDAGAAREAWLGNLLTPSSLE